MNNIKKVQENGLSPGMVSRPSYKVHFFYVFIDLAAMGLSFYMSYLLKFNSFKSILTHAHTPFMLEYSFIFILWSIFLVISLKRKNLYHTDRGISFLKENTRVFMCVISTAILIGAVIFFSQYKFFSREAFLYCNIMLYLSLGGWRAVKRMILRKLISDGLHNVNVLVIGAGRIGKMVPQEINKIPWWGFRIVGFLDDYVTGEVDNIPVLGRISDFTVVLKKHFVDEVIITIPSERATVSRLMRDAKNHRVGVRIVPHNFEEPLTVFDVNYLGIVPLLTYKIRNQHPSELFLKRLVDIIFSAALLVVLAPVFAIIAKLTKFDSKGPVFYVQKRVGLKGNLFNFYKFRSMVANADTLKSELLEKNEVKDGMIFKIRKDPRITAFGSFLRRYSLDETPQLLNVLKGDMSLVGPRPPTCDEVTQYDFSHMQRLSIRPGMTGLSQVRGRSALNFQKWVKWDAWYINNWSFGLDMKILWWTIPAVLKGKGAY